MSATADVAQISYFLKERFTQPRMNELCYPSQAALWGMLTKKTGWSGERKSIPLQYADITGVGSSLVVAQANKRATKGVKFQIDTDDLPEDYALFGVKIKAMRAAKGGDSSWRKTVSSQVKSAFRQVARRNAWGVWRSYRGDFATIKSTATLGSGATILITDRRHLMMFIEGGFINALDASNSYAKLSGRLQVTKVNPSGPSITVNTIPTTGIPSLAVGDKLCIESDHNSRYHGLDDIIPDTEPTTGDSFHGVDRSVSPEKLGGVRFDSAGYTIQEAVALAKQRNAELGGEADKLFLDFDNMISLSEVMQGRTEQVRTAAKDTKGKQIAEIGYEGFRFLTPLGRVEAYGDMYIPTSVGHLCQMDTLAFESMGEAPGWLNDMDGDSGWVVEKTDAAYEGRVGQFAEMTCDAPGWNVRLQNLGGTDEY